MLSCPFWPTKAVAQNQPRSRPKFHQGPHSTRASMQRQQQVGCGSWKLVGPLGSVVCLSERSKHLLAAWWAGHTTSIEALDDRGHGTNECFAGTLPLVNKSMLARRAKFSHALVWPLELGLRTPTLRCSHLSGPSRTRGALFEGVHKGRVHVIVPFSEWKNGKLFDCQQSYNVLVLRVPA